MQHLYTNDFANNTNNNNIYEAQLIKGITV